MWIKVDYCFLVPEFELPNEEQISYYEQLMMMSNETIVLSNFLDKKESLVNILIWLIYFMSSFMFNSDDDYLLINIHHLEYRL